jgi:pilus assembly protein CpaB
LKRSNRLVLLIGIFLAIVAFVAIVLLFQNGGTGGGTANPTTPTELPTVYAKVDIPFGTAVTADQLDTIVKPVDQRDPSAFADPGLVIGQIATSEILAGKQLTSADFALSTGGQKPVAPNIPQGLRAVAVQVDQVSGVGTLINVGDHVDMVTGFTGANFPAITVDPQTKALTPVQGINTTSVKVLLQNLLVVGTLLPPPPAQENAQASPAPSSPTTTLNGQQEIVILAVTPQQAEVVKFAQLDGTTTLALRSPKDYKDASGGTIIPANERTTGIILKTLVDEYGVLPPQVVETTLPRGVTAGP